MLSKSFNSGMLFKLKPKFKLRKDGYDIELGD